MSANSARHLSSAPPAITDEHLQRLGFLARSQVFPLEIFHQREDIRIAFGFGAHDGGDPPPAKLLGGSKTAVASHELVVAVDGPNDDWLQHAVRIERRGQFVH